MEGDGNRAGVPRETGWGSKLRKVTTATSAEGKGRGSGRAIMLSSSRHLCKEGGDHHCVHNQKTIPGSTHSREAVATAAKLRRSKPTFTKIVPKTLGSVALDWVCRAIHLIGELSGAKSAVL